MKNKGIFIILSGPSGTGKGTVAELLDECDNYCLSISATTRNPRAYEKDGEHYFFKTEDEFLKIKKADGFLESALFCGNYYGTPRDFAEKKLAEGKNVVLEIEVQGGLQVKERFPESILVFMMPPNKEELKRRLKKRGTESDEVISGRMQRAALEIEFIDKYDYLVINDDPEKAKKDIDIIVKAEHMRCSRNMYIKELF